MVNVSKHALANATRVHLKSELVDLFIANTTKKDLGNVLYELFSPTEKLMLEKRVGIIGLLVSEYSASEIQQLLKVSTSTIWEIEARLEQGHYQHICDLFKRKKARISIVNFLGNIMALGFPGVASKKLREKMKRDADAWRAGGK